MSSTTTYPLPPAPSWASDREIDQGDVVYDRAIGEVEGTYVGIGQRDSITGDCFEAGDVGILVGDYRLTPKQARQLAALLIEAASLAE
jgi:hypothetical protein